MITVTDEEILQIVNARKLRKKNRRNELLKWIAEYKKTLSCEICKESTPCCLDFHHRDGMTKKFNISQIKDLKKTEITFNILVEEIAKCDVLCANCHRKEHHRRKQRKVISNVVQRY